MSSTNIVSPTKPVLWTGLLWDAVYLSGDAYHFSPSKMSFANFPQYTVPPHAQNRDHKLQINVKSEHAHLCPTMNSLSGSTHSASFLREYFVLACLSLFWCFLISNLFLVKSGVIVGRPGEKSVTVIHYGDQSWKSTVCLKEVKNEQQHRNPVCAQTHSIFYCIQSD